MNLTTCIVCGREKKIDGQGRFINGDWADDMDLPVAYWREWVCCIGCYAKIPRLQLKEKP